MQQSLFRLKTYLHHSLRSFKSRKGYGIHSPFAFNFVTNIINPGSSAYFYCFETIEKLRHQLSYNSKIVRLDSGKESTIKSVCKTSASPTRDSQLLFRTALFTQAKNIVELGTSLGLSTAYLACANKHNRVVTIDHNKQIQAIAKENIKALKLDNVTFINGPFEDTMEQALSTLDSLDLMFFDGHHKGGATINYYNIAKEKTSTQSVFIFHDIHWSKDMHVAWRKICSDNTNTLSIECHNLGFVFFNPELNKQHFFV